MADYNPPLFAVWDPGEKKYLEDRGDKCVARWAKGTITRWGTLDHAAGDLCGREATESMGDIPLCYHHYDRAEKWLRKKIDADHYDRRIDRELELEAERQRSRWPESKLAEKEADLRKEEQRLERWELSLSQEFAKRSVIYYLRRSSDGLIKIGTTGNLSSRLSSLRGEHGEIRLLLTHNGSYARETELHSQFQDLWVEGEWFSPHKPLLEWILSQRQLEGAPVAPTTVPLEVVLELAAQAGGSEAVA